MSDLEYIMRHQLISKKVQFKSHVDLDVPLTIQGDKERLSQVLHNVLMNAGKFTPKGHIEFTATIEKDSQD